MYGLLGASGAREMNMRGTLTLGAHDPGQETREEKMQERMPCDAVRSGSDGAAGKERQVTQAGTQNPLYCSAAMPAPGHLSSSNKIQRNCKGL